MKRLKGKFSVLAAAAVFLFAVVSQVTAGQMMQMDRAKMAQQPQQAEQKLSSDPAKLSFGKINVEEVSAYQKVVIVNSGSAAVDLGLVVTGSDKDSFKLGSGACLNKAALQPGESCNVTIAFAPKAAGDKQAKLSRSATPTLLNVLLTGTGVAKQAKAVAAAAAPKVESKTAVKPSDGQTTPIAKINTKTTGKVLKVEKISVNNSTSNDIKIPQGDDVTLSCDWINDGAIVGRKWTLKFYEDGVPIRTVFYGGVYSSDATGRAQATHTYRPAHGHHMFLCSLDVDENNMSKIGKQMSFIVTPPEPINLQIEEISVNYSKSNKIEIEHGAYVTLSCYWKNKGTVTRPWNIKLFLDNKLLTTETESGSRGGISIIYPPDDGSHDFKCSLDEENTTWNNMGDTYAHIFFRVLPQGVKPAHEALSHQVAALPVSTLAKLLPPGYTIKTTASPAAGGSISPASATVVSGNTQEFAITINNGYVIDTVTGCPGKLDQACKKGPTPGSCLETYTAGPITADCTVNAVFKSAAPPSPTSTDSSIDLFAKCLTAKGAVFYETPT